LSELGRGVTSCLEGFVCLVRNVIGKVGNHAHERETKFDDPFDDCN